jgi:hypothetical protein
MSKHFGDEAKNCLLFIKEERLLRHKTQRLFSGSGLKDPCLKLLRQSIAVDGIKMNHTAFHVV